MKQPAKHFYEFGPYRLDTGERILLRDGHHVPLTPKAFETLLALIESGGRIVDKEELLKLIWPDTFVEEVSLAKKVSILRKVLGEDAGHHYIETIPRRGYRFVAEVREVSEETLSLRLQTNGENGTDEPHEPVKEKSEASSKMMVPDRSQKLARRWLWAAGFWQQVY